MDFQHRPGGKTGTYGVASAQNEAVDRQERLRKLALETIDIKKDPYFMTNHLGQFECKLCLTVHPNVGNYLAHTQGKRHQEGLNKRAAKEAKDRAASSALPMPAAASYIRKRTIKIGRPGYRVVKQRDAVTGARSLLFEVDYPEIEEGLQPRHRFMSAYEQRVEAPDRNWQYLMFAAEPYETIAFKIPALEVDRDPAKFFTHWDEARKVFLLQLHFRVARTGAADAAGGGSAKRVLHA